jgi:hypothetical protein
MPESDRRSLRNLARLGSWELASSRKVANKFECQFSRQSFRDGAVLLPYQAPWLAEFESELFSFPNGRHDDQVDSISQALRHERTAVQWTRESTIGMENFHHGLGALTGALPNRSSFEAMGIGGVHAYLLGLTR